jgi:hypothetical protein
MQHPTQDEIPKKRKLIKFTLMAVFLVLLVCGDAWILRGRSLIEQIRIGLTGFGLTYVISKFAYLPIVAIIWINFLVIPSRLNRQFDALIQEGDNYIAARQFDKAREAFIKAKSLSYHSLIKFSTPYKPFRLVALTKLSNLYKLTGDGANQQDVDEVIQRISPREQAPKYQIDKMLKDVFRL